MRKESTHLVVTISKVSFYSPANYFIWISLRGPKGFGETTHRTDVSPTSSSPDFKETTFHFELPASAVDKRKQSFRWLKSGGQEDSFELVCTACRIRREKGTVEVVGDIIIPAQTVLERLLGGERHVSSYGFMARTDDDEPIGRARIQLLVEPGKPVDSAEPSKEARGDESAKEPRQRNPSNGSHKVSQEWERIADEQMPPLPAKVVKKKAEHPTSRSSSHKDHPPNPGGQRLVIIVHKVWNIPFVLDPGTGKRMLPRAFVIAKTRKSGPKQKAATPLAPPCREPSFGVHLIMELSEPYDVSHGFELQLTVADGGTRRIFARYILPISRVWLPSHRQVTLLLKSNMEDNDPSPHLLVSLTNLNPGFTRTIDLRREYDKPVVVVGGVLREFVSETLPSPMRVYAVLKIDDPKYLLEREDILQQQLQPHLQLEFDSHGQLLSGNPMEDMSIPHLVYQNQYRSRSTRDQYYQITPSCESSMNPVWRQPFTFVLDHEDITDRTCLCIEFYREAPPPQEAFEILEEQRPYTQSNDHCFGYSIIPLDELFQSNLVKGGQPIVLDAVKVRYFSPYSKHPVTRNAEISLEIDCPEDWKPVPSSKSKQFGTGPLHFMGFDSLLKTVRAHRGGAEQVKPASFETDQKLDVKQLTFTYRDIEQRQQLIDRLTKEMDARTEAVKKVGQDLLRVREINARLEAKIRTLENKLDDADMRTARLLNTSDLDVLSSDELRRRYYILRGLQKEVHANQRLQNELEEAHRSTIERNELEKRFLEIREAHTAQQAYLQKLQDKLEKASKFKLAMQKQEVVIKKLEELLKEALQADVQGGQTRLSAFVQSACRDPETFESGVCKLLAEENVALSERILKLEKQQSGKRDTETSQPGAENEETRNPEQEDESRKANRHELSIMSARAERAEARVKALEEELVRSAKSFAQQLAEMRMRSIGQSRTQAS
ncbi:uncharacterized protein SPPG_00123 [Spizellomyces punctatus DAOM BR117]|uniref:C2 domain-containing protein n=1 Tax=Spizellomyces punctatus (strain DAOM BR117) TaxID=645134 RepID=A0A0L0HTG2_SPIPD|nr:uncharacterized protein SPPG_00123 [Spizellomyces punctatus DAOM BR117]KND04392.1 hypothetical protein SPPG_00123 [Spizellomyces punctatus DAOM BR117]|eukprot:XP_016612431.1 hypothetical protein SPPG_00123 [Spizellomyces punctatus DAOM BR117]